MSSSSFLSVQNSQGVAYPFSPSSQDTLPETLAARPDSVSLYLRQQPLDPADLTALAHSSVSRLWVEDCPLSPSAYQALFQNPRLEALTFTACHTRQHLPAAAFTSFISNTSVRSLSFTGYALSFISLRHLALGLRGNSTLQAFTLSASSPDTPQAPLSLGYILPLLRSLARCPSLTSLDLSGLGLDPETLCLTSDLLFSLHQYQRPSSLTSLNLSRNFHTPQTSAHLAALFLPSSAPSLHPPAPVSVDITPFCSPEEGDIGSEGVEAWVPALTPSEMLAPCVVESLSLGSYSASPEAWGALFATLASNTTLRALHVKGSLGVGPAVGILAEALAGNTTLRSLTLEGCYLGNHHLRVLGEALRAHSSLEHLSLKTNIISDARPLADLLTSGPALRTLDLGSNYVGKEGGRILAEALHANTTLQKLGHLGSGLSSAHKAQIARDLSRNRLLVG